MVLTTSSPGAPRQILTCGRAWRCRNEQQTLLMTTNAEGQQRITWWVLFCAVVGDLCMLPCICWCEKMPATRIGATSTKASIQTCQSHTQTASFPLPTFPFPSTFTPTPKQNLRTHCVLLSKRRSLRVSDNQQCRACQVVCGRCLLCGEPSTHHHPQALQHLLRLGSCSRPGRRV